MKNSNLRLRVPILALLTVCSWTAAYAQITPSQDAYTNTATPTTNFGTKPLLDVQSASQTTYIQFDLSSIPSGYTSGNVAKATLKLYVNAVTAAGSFNVDFVNGTWSEKTITANLAPALGTTIASSVPLATANVHDYVLIDVTSAVGGWLDGTQANDGIALVANSPLNASFDSKENTATSQPAELDIVFTGGGTITGIKTGAGSGLMGGGSSGTLTLSLINTCAAGQVLQWNGAVWVCASAGSGTVTSVASGAGLVGGPITSSGTLSIDTTRVPQLNANNTFIGNQAVSGTITTTGAVGIGISTPSYLLHVNGTARAEGGLSLGGFAPVAVDAPGIVGGRFAVLANGNVGIGVNAPANQLDVYAQSYTVNAINAVGGSAAFGSGSNGSAGVVAIGGNGDPNNLQSGGNGVNGTGGSAGGCDLLGFCAGGGAGISGKGGDGGSTGYGGYGVQGTGAHGVVSDGVGGYFRGGT